MTIFICPKCESEDVFLDKSGNNTGLYCGDCGRFIKWVSKDEIRLVKRQMKLMQDVNIKQIKNITRSGD